MKHLCFPVLLMFFHPVSTQGHRTVSNAYNDDTFSVKMHKHIRKYNANVKKLIDDGSV